MSYIANIDGGSRGNPGLSGFGIVVRDGRGRHVAKHCGRLPRATCNEAEYAALVNLLRLAVDHQWFPLHIRGDSNLLIMQASGRWKVKAVNLKGLHADVRALLSQAGTVTWEWIPRANNAEADELANVAMDAA